MTITKIRLFLSVGDDMKSIFKDCSCISWLTLLALLAVFTGPVPVLATDDVVPFFAGRTGSPNVMILFDNSNSMQDSPYFRADGNIYTPSTYWRRGVKINPDCDDKTPGDQPCIAENANGNILYDDSKYVTTSDELILPGQNPPQIPLTNGSTTLSSTVTSIPSNTCSYDSSLKCSYHIEDSNVDWSQVSDSTYKYWRVDITDDQGNVQHRTLRSDSTSTNGYFRTERDIEYNPNHTYTYTLVSGQPGEVTRLNSNARHIFDRNFQWSSITSSVFNTLYNGRVLEVYQGTNAGEKRIINGYDISSGYWKVSASFSQPLDYTSKYRIFNRADVNKDNKKAKGGNHPDSKMYQAKLALQKFLNSSAIKTTDTDKNGGTTDRYLMNIGFATFLQARAPQTRAKYYRKRGVVHPPYFSYMYRANYSHSNKTYVPTGCTDSDHDGIGDVPPALASFDLYGHHDNIANGGVVDRSYQSGQCSEQTIRYQVTYTCSPTDSLPYRVKVNLKSDKNWTDPALAGKDPDDNPQWGYTWVGWRWFEDTNNTGDCTSFAPPDPLWGSNHLIQSGETCYQACRNYSAWTENPYYETTWRVTHGDLWKTNAVTPGYIEKNPASEDTYIVTPYKGYCRYMDSAGHSRRDWNCPNPDPENISGDGLGDWTLLDHDLINVPVNRNGDLGNITSEIFDYSVYQYPGRTNDADHPHGWSYKRTANPKLDHHYKDDDGAWLDDHFIYVKDFSYSSIWPDSIQPDPYFPSDSADDFANYKGDDQVVFVDLPVFNDADAKKGDDVSGTNIQKVLNSINLARIEDPYDRRYVWTMAPINKDSLTVNESVAQPGVGTPLAATLADARKYFKSYMEQDEYSLGGCRNNYIILLTDGNETAGGKPADEAYLLQHIVVNGEEHPVKVYVIGFGLDAQSKKDLDGIAEAGGSKNHGTDADPKYAYFANNVDELVSILAHDITSDILGGSYGRGKATLTPGSQQGVSGDLALYNAYFDYPVWRGHLEAWSLYPEDVYDSDGNLLHRAGSLKLDAGGNKIGEPNWSDGCGDTISPAKPGDPDAGCIMAEVNDEPGVPPDGPETRRTLYTTKLDGGRIEFSPANIGTLKDLVNPPVTDTNSDGIPDAGEDIDGDGIAGTDLDAKAIINYIHHPGFDNAKYIGTRDENWPLADIYNSGPILVTAPRKADCLDTNNDGVLDPGSWPSMDGYCDFAEQYKSREGMLYFGTNGGMIEGITAGQQNVPLTGGREKWGYLPSFVLPKLQEIKEGHRFTMDLTVMASEVDTSDGLDGTGWKTMLVAGQRKGGNNYIALDVTDVDDPQPMWEFSDTNFSDNLGQTWSRPEVARIEIAGVKQSVLIFGGGYSTNANVGNRIYIVKALDGTILKEIIVGSQANNIPGRVTLMPYLVDNAGNIVDYRTNEAKLPDGTPVDYSDRYNFIEVGYFGDTSGDVYRLDGLNSKSGDPWRPHVTRLYHPDSDHARPIYYAPVITDIKTGTIDNGIMTGCVKRYVLVGTGDEHDPIATKKADFSPMLDYFMEIEDTGETCNPNGFDVMDGICNAKSAGDERYLDWRFNLGMQLPLDQFGFLLQPDGSRAMKDTNGDGTGDKEILSKYIYLANAADGYTVNVNGQLVNSDNEIVAMPGNSSSYDPAHGYSINEDDQLVNSANEIIAQAGSFDFKDKGGNVYHPADGYSINENGQLIDSANDVKAEQGNFYFVTVTMNFYFKDVPGNLYSDSALTHQMVDAGTYVQVDTSLWLTDVYGWFYDSEDGVKILDTTRYSYDNDGFMLVGADKITPGGAVCDPSHDACVKVVSDPGEKILSQPVGYGRYMYFTTYTPVGGCSTGTSYFYGLKTSSCEPLGGAGTLNYSKVGEGLVPGLRRRIRLGKGISPGPTLGGGTAYVPLYSPGNPPEINAIPVTVGETKLKYWKQN